jgi:hypothetical protein
MLELATVMNTMSFERTVQFIGVSLEERAREDDPRDQGTRGSRTLAAYAREEGWLLEGVVVLESVAFAGDSVEQRAPDGVPVEVPETGNFIAVIGNEASLGLVQDFVLALDRHRIRLPNATLVVPGNGETLPDSRRSDHAPFWDNGYRAIMLTDTTNFRNPHYHRPSDTLETLNLDFAAQVCRATGGLLIDIAGAVDLS